MWISRLNEGVKELWLEEGALKGVILEQGPKGSGLGRYRYDGRPLLSDHRFNRRRVPLCKRGRPQRDQDKPGPGSFTTEETVVKDLQGLSLRNVEVVIRDGKKELYRDFGEMLFTHFGVSGSCASQRQRILRSGLKRKRHTFYRSEAGAFRQNSWMPGFSRTLTRRRTGSIRMR